MTSAYLHTTATRNDYDRLPGSLSRLGIPVPEALTDAVKRAQWTIMPSPASEVNEIRDRLYNAKTEPEWFAAQQAMLDLSIQITAYEELHSTIQGVTQSRLPRALDECLSEVFEGLITKYNEHAAPFSEAASKLPDLHNRQATVFDISPEETAAIHEAKRNADVMNDVLAVYATVLKVKNINPVSALVSGSDAMMAARIGKYEEWSQLRTTAENISMYGRDYGRESTLKPLAPHIAVTLSGGTLELKDPHAAIRAVEELNERSAPDQDNRNVGAASAKLHPEVPDYV
jgi:hypothetical protein